MGEDEAVSCLIRSVHNKLCGRYTNHLRGEGGFDPFRNVIGAVVVHVLSVSLYASMTGSTLGLFPNGTYHSN
jgi:hypothetical protein